MCRSSSLKKILTTIMFVGFFLATCLFAYLFLPKTEISGASSGLQIYFDGSPVGAYSDLFLNGEKLEQELYNKLNLSGHFIKVKGSLEGDTFTWGQTQSGSNNHYLIIDCENFKTKNGESALDEDGRIILPPSTTPYKFDFSQSDNNTFVIDGEGDLENADYLWGTLEYRVQKKSITVAIDEAYLNNDESKECDYAISRIFGQEPLSLEFSVIDDFPFSKTHGHTLECTGNFNGNGKYDKCGEYEVYIDTNGIKIKANGEDVSHCYDIKCNNSIHIFVEPKEVFYPIFSQIEEEYTLEGKEVDKTLKEFSQYFNGSEIEGLQDDVFSMEILYSCIYKEEDLDDNGNLKVGSSYYYEPSIKNVTLNGNRLSANNFLFSLKDSEGYKKTIIPRKILIYLQGVEPSNEPGIATTIGIDKNAFSEVYGKAYQALSTYTLSVADLDNMELEITYSIENPKGIDTEEGFILDVDEYNLTNVTAENENFDITVDNSLMLVITKGTLTLDELMEEGVLYSPDGEKIEEYNFLSKEYDNSFSGESSYKILFEKTLSNAEINFSIDFSIDVKEGLPGVYTPEIAYDEYYGICEQYHIEGIEKLSLTITKPYISVTISNKEYDGKSFTPPSLDSQSVESLSLSYDFSYKNAKGSNITSAPINAGTYKLVIALKDDSKNFYRFKNNESEIEIEFTITPRAVTVDATVLKDTKPFGQSVSIGKIVTFDIYHTVDKSLVAVVDNKDLITASCDGIQSTAVPGSYSIKLTANSKISANYDITYTQNNLKMTVTKTDLASLVKSKALEANASNVISTTNSIGLTSKTLYSASLEKYLSMEYRLYDDENEGEWISVSSLTVSEGIEEGAKYQLRYVLSKTNPYVDLKEDFKSEESAYIVLATTKINIPIISNDDDSLSSTNITIIIENYETSSSYSWIIGYETEDGYIEDEYPFDSSKVTGEDVFYYKLCDTEIILLPDTEYRIYLKRLGKNADVYEISEPCDITTARLKPELDKSAFEIGQSSIKFFEEEGEDSPQFVYYYVLLNRGHTSIESSANSENPEVEKYFIDEQYLEDVIKGEGASITDLESDCIYAVKIAYLETEDKPESDGVYYLIHTLPDTTSSVASTGILNTISKYLLSGGTVLFLVLFIIVVIRYAVISKRLRRRVK